MKKMLAVLLVALALFVSGCSALGAVASMASDALGEPSASGVPGEPSASGTPFPVTVHTPFAFAFGEATDNAAPDDAVAEDTATDDPAADDPAADEPSEPASASPSPSGSSSELNVGDVIETVENRMPIGLQFLIDQIESLFNTLTGQAGN